MLAALGLIFTYCLMVVLIGALGVGQGLLLYWIIPGIQMGHAVIAGMILTVYTLYVFSKLLNSSFRELSDRNKEEEPEPEPEPEPSIVVIPRDIFFSRSQRSKSKKREKVVNPKK